MTIEEDRAHTLTLRNLILDVLESYNTSHPDITAQLVLAALGETFINLGVSQLGIDWTKGLCDELKKSVDRVTK